MTAKEGSAFEDIKGIIDGWIHGIIHRDNARDRSNFRYISYDWIEPRGWFFWPKKSTGVFALKEALNSDYGTKGALYFNLHYFPDIEEDVFSDFSCAEQLVRVSDLFSKEGVEFVAACMLHEHDDNSVHMEDLSNGKGIPALEARERLNPCLFVIAQIGFHFHDAGLAAVSLYAPSRSATMAVRDIVIRENESSEPVVVVGERETDRYAPAWDIAFQFCRDLIEDASIAAEAEVIMGLNDYDINEARFTLS